MVLQEAKVSYLIHFIASVLSPRSFCSYELIDYPGSGVVHELLKDGTWTVRAVTRNPESNKAKELAQSGAEIVYASFEDVKY